MALIVQAILSAASYNFQSGMALEALKSFSSRKPNLYMHWKAFRRDDHGEVEKDTIRFRAIKAQAYDNPNTFEPVSKE
jgi:hypothetical protein